MKFITFTSFTILLLSFFSCKKSNNPINDQLIDSVYFKPSAYKLKDYKNAEISSSDYNFNYDAMGRLTSFTHASGLYQYKCFYNGKALYKIINQNPLTSADTIKYNYQKGLLASIDIIPEHQAVTEKLELFYDDLKRVTHINWLLNDNKKWHINRRLEFSYYSDHNIRTFRNYYFNGSDLVLFDSSSYHSYDNKINPKTNFFISGTLNDHFVYLPYVKFQINNPVSESLSRGTNIFNTQHNYTYLDKLPISDHKTINVIPNYGIPYNFNTTEFYEYH